MHEKSETIQNAKGKWINVYGKGLPKEGQVLPILHPRFEKEEYDTEREAVASAKQRSDLNPEPKKMLSPYIEEQEFDADGNAIPISDKKIVGPAEPKSMEYSEEEILKAEEIEKAGNDWKEELKRMMRTIGKTEPKKEEGMLSTVKEESTAKEKKIAEGYHQMPDGSVMKDEDHKEEVSTDVAKDLDNEGRGLKGYKPPVDKMKEGWKQVEGSNAISVDEKSEHWQTKKGYDEAIKMYGTKPAWVKEPSLIYNPKTKKYDPIEKEEFVDLKPKQDLSAFA